MSSSTAPHPQSQLPWSSRSSFPVNLTRPCWSQNPAPLCHSLSVRSWISHSTPVGRIKWKKLCKNALSTVKSLTNIETFMTHGAVFQSNWKQIFLREKLFLWKATVRDLRAGSVCSLLCSLFDYFWWMIPFKPTPNTALRLINRWSSPIVCFCSLLFSRILPLCFLGRHAHTYTRTRTHMHTHPVPQQRWWAVWVCINEVTDSSLYFGVVFP